MRVGNLIMTSFFILAFASTSFGAEMYGIFMIVKGDVKLQVGANPPIPAKVGTKVNVGDSITSGPDSRAKVVMSDRNVINISPDTKMKLDKYENDSKTDKHNVEMTLVQGKVRNNVEQTYDGEKNKFIIKTPTAVAGVRGTQFFTSFDPTTRITSIVALKGSVSVSSIGARGEVIGKPVVVKKGEMTSAVPGAPAEAPKVVPKDEMKKIDIESTAGAKSQKNEETKSTAAASDKPEKGDKPEKSEKGDKAGPPREPSSVPAGPEPQMVDNHDMDLGIAKDIKPLGPVEPPPPPILPPNLAPPPPPTINPSVTDIIRTIQNKANVVVRPVPQ